MYPRILALMSCLLCGGLALAGDPEVIRIGLVDSMVEDLSSGQKKFIDNEFNSMVLDFTGLKSQVMQGGAVMQASKKLAAKEWNFAVLQGIEFAWAQSQDSKLQPLMVAVYKEPTIHALLVTMKDAKAAAFADVKGKNISLLTKLHCRLYADKPTGGAKAFFGNVAATSDTEQALDSILLGKVDAAIVDNAARENYKNLNPGRWARLKVIAESTPFPSAVIAYRQGDLSDAILEKFRAGMLKANNSDRGKEVMATFKISSFEAVPSDYTKQLETILKVYPPPR